MQASSSSKTQPFVPNDLSFLFDDGPGQIQPPDGSVPLSDQHLFAHDPYAGTSAGGSYHDGRSESPGHDAGGSQSGSQTAEGSKTSGPRKSQRQPLSCTECTRSVEARRTVEEGEEVPPARRAAAEPGGGTSSDD